MNLHNIEAFLAVGETGSFTSAARRLLKTQSAVSQAIRQLEDEVGAVLIDRSVRTFALTPAGELLRSKAAHLIDDIKKMTALVREQSKARVRQLRIGMVDSFATAVGPVLIQCMLEEALNLTLWSDLTPRLGEALIEKRADIVVLNEAMEGETHLTRYELLREPFVLLLPATMAWNASAPDLGLLSRAYPMVRYEALSHMGAQIDSQCRRLNVSPMRRVSVDSTEKLIAAVASGIGWSIGTPISLLRSREYSRQIRVMPFPGESFHRRLYMLSRRGEFDELALRLARLAVTELEALVSGELRRLLPRIYPDIFVTNVADMRAL